MSSRGPHRIIRFLRSVERVTSRKALRFMIEILPLVSPFLPVIGNFFAATLTYISDHAKQYADALEKKYIDSGMPENNSSTAEALDKDNRCNKQEDDHKSGKEKNTSQLMIK